MKEEGEIPVVETGGKIPVVEKMMEEDEAIAGLNLMFNYMILNLMFNLISIKFDV